MRKCKRSLQKCLVEGVQIYGAVGREEYGTEVLFCFKENSQDVCMLVGKMHWGNGDRRSHVPEGTSTRLTFFL